MKSDKKNNGNIIERTEDGGAKITFQLSRLYSIKCLLCLALGFAGMFSDMSPFSFGFYAAVFSKSNWIYSLFFAFAGIFLSGVDSAWLYAVCLAGITVIFALSDIFERFNMRVICSCALLFACRLVSGFADGFIIFDFFAAVLEVMILAAFMIVTNKGYAIVSSKGSRTFISSFERLCVFAFIAVVIMSISKINIYDRINLSSTVAIICIFVLCLSENAESATVFGVIMGVTVAMSSHPGSDIAGVYGFGALLGAALARYKKPGVVFGFVLSSTFFALLISDYSRIYAGIGESLIAAIIFALMPRKAICRIASLFAQNIPGDEEAFRKRIRKDDFIELRKMSESFRELSGIYISCSAEKKPGKGYLTSRLSGISSKICGSCSNKSICLDFNNEFAYENINSMLEKAMKNGGIKSSELPVRMKNICHRKEGFVDSFNSVAELIRIEKMWLGKINESRKLIGEQLTGVADAIDKICDYEGQYPDVRLEETLRTQLDKMGVYPVALSAYSDIDGEFSIYVRFKEGFVNTDDKEKIMLCIENITLRKTRFVSSVKKKNEIIFLFCPQPRYRVSFGYASVAKDGERENGDTFDIISPGKNSYVMALSDGMGSGVSARTQSNVAISLLKKFLNAGFDSDTAVRLINSSLLLKSTKDSFATVDICTIDLGSHCLTFTKLGASDAYIKCNDKISVIHGKSLPAGILKEIEIENHMLPIAADTVVVIMSDGVGDISIKSPESEGWIEKELMLLDTENPQIIASKLLEKAKRLDGNSPADDMTVVVAYISDTFK